MPIMNCIICNKTLTRASCCHLFYDDLDTYDNIIAIVNLTECYSVQYWIRNNMSEIYKISSPGTVNASMKRIATIPGKDLLFFVGDDLSNKIEQLECLI